LQLASQRSVDIACVYVYVGAAHTHATPGDWRGGGGLVSIYLHLQHATSARTYEAVPPCTCLPPRPASAHGWPGPWDDGDTGIWRIYLAVGTHTRRDTAEATQSESESRMDGRWRAVRGGRERERERGVVSPYLP
jgi:hypothetical protein